jgi:hypothetical protein
MSGAHRALALLGLALAALSAPCPAHSAEPARGPSETR